MFFASRLLYIISILSATMYMVSCSGPGEKPHSFMPELEKTDSVELIYFRTPDSVRYFTYLPSTDSGLIATMVRELQQDTVTEISCMKEGKIYLFRRGEIFNTVFFGYNDPGCRFLRFIKNGRMYTYPLNDEFRKLLESGKTLAREPVAGKF